MIYSTWFGARSIDIQDEPRMLSDIANEVASFLRSRFPNLMYREELISNMMVVSRGSVYLIEEGVVVVKEKLTESKKAIIAPDYILQRHMGKRCAVQTRNPDAGRVLAPARGVVSTISLGRVRVPYGHVKGIDIHMTGRKTSVERLSMELKRLSPHFQRFKGELQKLVKQ